MGKIDPLYIELMMVEQLCCYDLTIACVRGHLECLSLFKAQGVMPSEWHCALTAFYGRLEALKYLHEVMYAPWDKSTCLSANLGKNEDCFSYAYKNGCPCYLEDSKGLSFRRIKACKN